MKILVVEHIGFLRHSLEQSLKTNGFAVASVSNGEQALHMLKRDSKIDVVITDLMMPGMTGIDLMKESKSIERIDDSGTALTPQFIMMTTPQREAPDSKQGMLVQQAIDLGIVDMLLKPIEVDILVSRLHRLQLATMDGATESDTQAGDDQSAQSTEVVGQNVRELQSLRNRFVELQNSLTSQLQRLDQALLKITQS